MGQDGEAVMGSVRGKLLLVEIRKVNKLSPSYSLHQPPTPAVPWLHLLILGCQAAIAAANCAPAPAGWQRAGRQGRGFAG